MAAGGTALGAPVIVVHSLAHAVAALRAAADAGQEIVVASAADAGVYVGPGWWRELVKAAREAVPDASATALLDCGGDSGAAMGAIRAGVEGIVFTGRADVAARLADVAGQHGARLVANRPEPGLDLGAVFFADEDTLRRRCADILASLPRSC
jgi:hypothetical protein